MSPRSWSWASSSGFLNHRKNAIVWDTPLWISNRTRPRCFQCRGTRPTTPRTRSVLGHTTPKVTSPPKRNGRRPNTATSCLPSFALAGPPLPYSSPPQGGHDRGAGNARLRRSEILVFAKPLEKPVRLGLIDDHELVARVVVGQDFRPGDVEPPGVQAQSPGLQALPHGRVAPEVF